MERPIAMSWRPQTRGLFVRALAGERAAGDKLIAMLVRPESSDTDRSEAIEALGEIGRRLRHLVPNADDLERDAARLIEELKNGHP